VGWPQHAQENAIRDHRELNTEIEAGLADPRLKARFAHLGGTVLLGLAADFGKLIAMATRAITGS
jgi:hypothetical protein